MNGSDYKAEYLNVEAMMNLLALSRSQIYYLMGSGAFPIVQIGRSVRVDRAKLQVWLDNGGDRDVARPGPRGKKQTAEAAKV